MDLILLHSLSVQHNNNNSIPRSRRSPGSTPHHSIHFLKTTQSKGLTGHCTATPIHPLYELKINCNYCHTNRKTGQTCFAVCVTIIATIFYSFFIYHQKIAACTIKKKMHIESLHSLCYCDHVVLVTLRSSYVY